MARVIPLSGIRANKIRQKHVLLVMPMTESRCHVWNWIIDGVLGRVDRRRRPFENGSSSNGMRL
jgi:hypothetical protein